MTVCDCVSVALRLAKVAPEVPPKSIVPSKAPSVTVLLLLGLVGMTIEPGPGSPSTEMVAPSSRVLVVGPLGSRFSTCDVPNSSPVIVTVTLCSVP